MYDAQTGDSLLFATVRQCEKTPFLFMGKDQLVHSPKTAACNIQTCRNLKGDLGKPLRELGHLTCCEKTFTAHGIISLLR